MPDLNGTIVVSKLQPTNTADTYPTHEDIYGEGGYMVADSIATRDAIPAERRKELMMCGVQANATIYCLVGGITNADWQSLWVLAPLTDSLLTEGGDYLMSEDGTQFSLEAA